MNELIYKLTKQADTLARVIEPDLREIVRYNRIRDEKFAELIVRECVEVAHCNFHVDGLTLGGIIKEHFGVEE
jgi:hypothetical protein